MPDRIIRDELLESGRWLDLPNDTARLCYLGLLLRCDDFGNIEGGPRRLFRFFFRFAQVKNEADADAVIQQLADADLIRRYEVEQRELFHLPRFKAGRDYLVRRFPPSPWCDQNALIGKHKRIINKGLAKNVAKDSANVNATFYQGVGVGVGVGDNKNELRPVDNSNPVDNSTAAATTKPKTWAQFWKAQGAAFGIKPIQGETEGEYCRRVQSIAKEKA